MKLKKKIYLTLTIMFLSTILIQASGMNSLARLPGDGSVIDDSSLFQFLQGKGEDDIRSFLEGVMENDVVPDRPDEYYPIQRGASEDKFFGDAQSLSDMELFYTPHWEPSPYNWTLPPWPDVPYDYPNPPQWEEPDIPGWYLFGCWISCFPGVLYCDEDNIECTITTPQTISSIDVTGQVADWYLDGDILYIEPSFQAEDNTYVNIKVCTEPNVSWQGKGGCCEARVVIQGCGCECVGATPTIIADSDTDTNTGDICHDASNSGTFYVESDGLACPPYEWELTSSDGGGLKLDGQLAPATSETAADGETVTVSSTGVCGAGTLTVTDQCGFQDTYTIACRTGGNWTTIKSTGLGDSAEESCVLSGAATSAVAGQMLKVSGYKRQYHNYITVGNYVTTCGGSQCTGSNDCEYDGNPPGTDCCGGGCPTYGCYDCLTWDGTLTGCLPGTFHIEDMCGCGQCWHVTNGYFQCACNCSTAFVYQEYQCP